MAQESSEAADRRSVLNVAWVTHKGASQVSCIYKGIQVID
jgi:hypothetical protein